MSEAMQRLFNERLARHQAAVALEPLDRVPLAMNADYPQVYSGRTEQELIYDLDKLSDALVKFVQDFSEFDALAPREGRFGPLEDTVGSRLYRLSGRDLPPNVQFQFVEQEWMKADEYDLLIDDPVEFLMERFLPRVFSEFQERGSTRSYIAFLKAGMAFTERRAKWREMVARLETEYGMPRVYVGSIRAPFDKLADRLRGLQGIMIDIHRQPEKVIAACDALVPTLVDITLAEADPLRRYPIFLPLHRGCTPFLSPKQFDTFYWPSLKKELLLLIEAGYTVRLFMEGDWTAHWHHVRELPRGKVICHIDKSDIFQAKEEVGDWACIAGGVPETLLILGTPDQIRSRVQELCERVGKDGGFLIACNTPIPGTTKPENFRAFVDAVMEYGRYSDTEKPEPKSWTGTAASSDQKPAVTMVTPWKIKLEELGSILGDEISIKAPWETLERIAYHWLWYWT